MIYDDMLAQMSKKTENIKEKYSNKFNFLKKHRITDPCSDNELDEDIKNNNAARNELSKLAGLCDNIDEILHKYEVELKKFNNEREYVAELISALRSLKEFLSPEINNQLTQVSNFGDVSFDDKDISHWLKEALKIFTTLKAEDMPRLKFRYNVEDIQNKDLKEAYTIAQEIFTHVEKALENKVREHGGNVSKSVSLTLNSTIDVANNIKRLLDCCITLEENSNQYIMQLLPDTKKHVKNLAYKISKFEVNCQESPTAVDEPSGFLQELSKIFDHTGNWNDFYNVLYEFNKNYGMEIYVHDNWKSKDDKEAYQIMVDEIEDKYENLRRIVNLCNGFENSSKNTTSNNNTYLKNETEETEKENKKLSKDKKKERKSADNNKKKKGIFHKIQKLLNQKNH